MKKCSEAGRSMLEVIAVLALGAFIVYGGLHLWQMVQLRNQAQVLIQRVVAMKAARQVAMPAHADQPLIRSEMGPFGIMISIRNGQVEQKWCISRGCSFRIQR